MKDVETRIKNGINFFRKYAGPNYDAAIFKQYFPKFLDLVESHLKGEQPYDEYKTAQDIFKPNEN